ncbi:MAG TPA: hypothetical protein VHX38_18635 [Pseudonocardiaceae bacterium]|jgi:hypothetical protein|nr:hypothetical protein [Pseudonocardiaceae bacterium]
MPEQPDPAMTFRQHKARVDAHAKLLANQMSEALDLPDGVCIEYRAVGATEEAAHG